MAIEKLKFNKTQILITIKAINSDIRPQTQHRNPEHIYLKFLTPLTLSVEKTVHVHMFKQVYKPININVLVSVLIMLWQCISPEVNVKSFKKSSIPSAMDGTGDMLWDGSEEDKNARSV